MLDYLHPNLEMPLAISSDRMLKVNLRPSINHSQQFASQNDTKSPSQRQRSYLFACDELSECVERIAQ